MMGTSVERAVLLRLDYSLACDGSNAIIRLLQSVFAVNARRRLQTRAACVVTLFARSSAFPAHCRRP